MLENLKRIRILLNKCKLKKWNESKSSNKTKTGVKTEIRAILKLLSGKLSLKFDSHIINIKMKID